MVGNYVCVCVRVGVCVGERVLRVGGFTVESSNRWEKQVNERMHIPRDKR